MLRAKMDREPEPELRRPSGTSIKIAMYTVAHPVIHSLECKACGRCIVACPKEVLSMSHEINARGYHFVEYAGEGCTGCGNCFYTCPEPMALEVHIPPHGMKPKMKLSQKSRT